LFRTHFRKANLGAEISVRNLCTLILIIVSIPSYAAEVGTPTDNVNLSNAEHLYNETCVVCHGAGIGGAPKPGIKADWEFRMADGIENLHLNAIEGMGPAMPPRGMCSDCSDNDLRAVVRYMVADLE
jgi:cytochrome c5